MAIGRLNGRNSGQYPSAVVVPVEIISSNHDNNAESLPSQRFKEIRCQHRNILNCLIIITTGSVYFFFVLFLEISGSKRIQTEPCISIESFDVITPLNLTYPRIPSNTSPSSSLTGSWSWNISFGYYNLSDVRIIYYDNVNLKMYCGNFTVGKATIPAVDLQQDKNQTWINITTRVDADFVHLDDLVAYSLARDLNDRPVKYGVEVVAYARVKPKGVLGYKDKLRAYTNDTSTGRQSCG